MKILYKNRYDKQFLELFQTICMTMLRNENIVITDILSDENILILKKGGFKVESKFNANIISWS